MDEQINPIKEALQELYSESPMELREAYNELKDYIDDLINEI